MIYKKERSKFWYAAFYVKSADGKLIKRAVSTKTEDEEKVSRGGLKWATQGRVKTGHYFN